QLAFNGQTTATLAFNSSVSAIQTALAALSTINFTSNVTVTGTTSAPVITFLGTLAYAFQNSITSTAGNLSAANTVTHTTAGSAGGQLLNTATLVIAQGDS